jgi:hypothetical protein
MINISKNSIIYIACPSFATGGPLALHQLGYKLKIKGYKVYMYYYGAKKLERPNIVHENYEHFNIPYVLELDDSQENLLIVPESKTDLLYLNKNIICIIWWLSIDNFFKINRRSEKLKIRLGLKRKFKFIDGNKFYHLAQSKYALEFLRKKESIDNNRIGMLSDYLLDIFFENQHKIEKEDIVLYNPTKGILFTQQIIKCNPNLNWIPIQKLTPEEVRALLNRSKAYIDFGEHPGRDRFPREAAISNCCILTGRKGSANYFEDIPIPNEFKFIDKDDSLGLISERINSILTNHENELSKFENYRKFIKDNETVFEQEIDALFCKN